MDFFTVPTLTFGVLQCCFVIAHDRRRILHCNVTRHPSSLWVTQQLREAFPYDAASNYLIFDRAANFSEEVISTVKSFGIVLNVRHLQRLMNEYISYYHDDRTHLALAKATPAGREEVRIPDAACRIVSMSRLGGLHHRYDLAA